MEGAASKGGGLGFNHGIFRAERSGITYSGHLRIDCMAPKLQARRLNPKTGVYYPNLVPLAAIRRFAREVVKRFRPEKIILFGSYACGTPTPDSDVDLLVVMPTRNQLEQAVSIDEAIERRGFPLDLIVRTPKNLETRLQWGDSFLQEIVTRGKVLYEKDHGPVAAQSRARHHRRKALTQTEASADR
jgi:predicted nucleotidyltransferase